MTFDEWWVEFSAGEKHLEMADWHVSMAAWNYQQERITDLKSNLNAYKEAEELWCRQNDKQVARIAELEAENQRLRDENAQLSGYDSWDEMKRHWRTNFEKATRL